MGVNEELIYITNPQLNILPIAGIYAQVIQSEPYAILVCSWKLGSESIALEEIIICSNKNV